MGNVFCLQMPFFRFSPALMGRYLVPQIIEAFQSDVDHSQKRIINVLDLHPIEVEIEGSVQTSPYSG